MDIYKLQNEGGDDFAFEMNNVYITKKQIAQLLSGIDQVDAIKVRQAWSSPDDVHVEFQYQGESFIVWEPFADSSRYWIGPKEKSCQVDMRHLQSAFEGFQPKLIRRILGDLLTLSFSSLFGKPK